MNKVLFPLLGALLLLQYCHCNLTDERYMRAPRNQVYSRVVKEGTKLCKYYAVEGGDIFQKVLQAIVPMRNKSDALQAHVATIADFNARVVELSALQINDLKNSPHICNVSIQFNELVKTYNSTLMSNATESKAPTVDVLLIELLLKKYGINAYGKEFFKRYSDFLLYFFRIVNKFMNSPASNDAREENDRLFLWLQDFDKATSIGDSLIMFKGAARFANFY